MRTHMRAHTRTQAHVHTHAMSERTYMAEERGRKVEEQHRRDVTLEAGDKRMLNGERVRKLQQNQRSQEEKMTATHNPTHPLASCW